MDALPLLSVARSWALSVTAYNGKGARALGYYQHGQAIALGVQNIATWAHELVHAADDRRGKLAGSSKLSREVVAELGGAVLASRARERLWPDSFDNQPRSTRRIAV